MLDARINKMKARRRRGRRRKRNTMTMRIRKSLWQVYGTGNGEVGMEKSILGMKVIECLINADFLAS